MLKVRIFGGAGPGAGSMLEHGTAGAVRRAMHPILHSFKRVYLRSVRITGDWAREYDLTPARFDMMTAIGLDSKGMAQNVLRRVLAVSASVVSRMLRSLEDLGFLRRVPHPRDRRTLWITLTYTGNERLREAQQDIMELPGAELLVVHAVAKHPAHVGSARSGLAAARELLHRCRSRLEDTSTLAYPYYLESGERSPEHPFCSVPRSWRKHVRRVTAAEEPRLSTHRIVHFAPRQRPHVLPALWR